MKKLIIHTDSCKSCGICVHECPKQALSISDAINGKGYKYVENDEEKCIKCGICYHMCPDAVFELLEV